MRNMAEVQRAHDVVHAVIANEVDLGINEQVRYSLRVTHDVLSWVLEGTCQQAFQNILNLIEAIAKERGYALVRKG